MPRRAIALTLLLLILSGLLSPLQSAFAACGGDVNQEIAWTVTSESSDDCNGCSTTPGCDCGDCGTCHSSSVTALILKPENSARVDSSERVMAHVDCIYMNPILFFEIDPPILYI